METKMMGVYFSALNFLSLPPGIQQYGLKPIAKLTNACRARLLSAPHQSQSGD